MCLISLSVKFKWYGYVCLNMAKGHMRRKGIDKRLSQKCTDIAVNSGSYDPFGDKETHYINQYGKVVTDKDPYGDLE